MSVLHYTETYSCNHCCRRKAVSFTYSEKVYLYPYTLGACAILTSVVSPAVLHVSTVSHKRYDFRGAGGGGNLINIKCVFRFSLQLRNISHSTKK